MGRLKQRTLERKQLEDADYEKRVKHAIVMVGNKGADRKYETPIAEAAEYYDIKKTTLWWRIHGAESCKHNKISLSYYFQKPLPAIRT